MAVQTIETLKGYQVSVKIYIDNDGAGGAPSTWDIETGNGVNLIGVATSVSTSGSTDITDITGLNQKDPYNTKAGNNSYEWSLDQLFTLTRLSDDTATTPIKYSPLDLLKNGTKFAMQIAGLDAAGESSGVSEDMTVVLTQCLVSDDEMSVDGSDGDLELTMSGRAATRTVAYTV